MQDIESERKYKNTKKYRDPWVYKVSDGIQIRYLNEPQIQTPEMQEKIKGEKLKLIEKFRNER